jgi:DNA-3-methyladenine glycosylase
VTRRVARFSRSFFARATAEVARDLLGARLVRVDGGRRTVGRIVETEAYPPGDPASHAARGPTRRAATMFRRPGLAYVYLIYGMYWCFNIVTEPEGVGAAVLVRGLDGLDGCNGPGRLCRRLGVDGRFDGVDLLAPGSPLRLVPGAGAVPEPVVTTTRVGISRAADRPLRYYLLGSPGVSRT